MLVPALERATHAVALLIEQELKDLGISQAEAHVLAYLVHVGQCSINDLHRDFGHRRSTLTSVLDRLERRGLVRRGPHPTSRRSVMVSLTDDGRQVGERVAALLHEIEHMVVNRTSRRDMEAFLRVVAAIEEGIP